MASPRSRRQQRRAAALVLAALLGFILAGASVVRDPVAVLRLAHRGLLRLDGVRGITADGVVLQRTLYDCGPAALANLMLAAGRSNPGPDTLAVLAGTSFRGTTLGGLESAARLFDLPVRRVTRSQTGGRLPAAPFIAWIDRNHFVVVAEAPTRGQLLIIDPRVGRFVTDERDFAGHWSGEALVVASTSAAAADP